MSEHFAFSRDKHKAAIAVAMSLGVVLLLSISPASLGFGGAFTTQEAFGQEPTPSASTFVLRGLIGSSLPAQGGDITTENNNSSHIVTGRFRVFANETLFRRLVAEMNVAAVDGSSFHNITIQEGSPHRFEVTPGNETNTAASSNIVGSIYLNNSPTPVIDNVPMTISIRGQVLAIEGIDIDETTITDTGQRDILSIIDGQSIYGIVAR